MSEAQAPPGALGFETFGTASGLAIISGAIALVVPMFTMLTVVLATLALAGWASLRHRKRRDPVRPAAVGLLLAVGLFAAAVALFLEPPPLVAPARSLLLGLGLVPLWVRERTGGSAPPAGREGR